MVITYNELRRWTDPGTDWCVMCNKEYTKHGDVRQWCMDCIAYAESHACADCGAFPHEECSYNCSSNWN